MSDRPFTRDDPRWVGLTDREWQVARGVAEGNSHQAIAAQLGISWRTVGTHLRSVYRTLGIHNRVQLTRALIDSGHLARPGAG
jgi:DNA-binding NarL/FixJ family response regulator